MTIKSTTSNHHARSSMLEWFPKIKDLDIPQPETRIVEIPFKKFMELLNGNSTLAEYSSQFSEIIGS